MVQRPTGWVLTPAHTGYISHFYPDKQTKSVCGVDCTYPLPSTPRPHNGSRVCKKCAKTVAKLRRLSKLLAT